MAEETSSNAAVAERVIAMIAKSKALPPESVTPASSFDSLEIDSLDKINLTFEVEEAFDITITDDSLNSLRTVGDVIAGVERLQAGKATAAAPEA